MNGTIDIDTDRATPAADYPALAQLLRRLLPPGLAARTTRLPTTRCRRSSDDTSAETVTAAASEIDRLLDAGFDDAAPDADARRRTSTATTSPETDGVTALAWLSQRSRRAARGCRLTRLDHRARGDAATRSEQRGEMQERRGHERWDRDDQRDDVDRSAEQADPVQHEEHDAGEPACCAAPTRCRRAPGAGRSAARAASAATGPA